MHGGRIAAFFLIAAACAHAETTGAAVGQWDSTSILSPDHRCSVVVSPYHEETDEHARLILDCKSSRKRVLASFFRTGYVIWAPDSSAIVFIDEHSPHEYSLRLFRLGAPVSNAADRLIRRKIEAALRGKEIIFYNLNFVKFPSADRAIIDADVEFLRTGTQGPADGVTFRFDVSLKTSAVTQLR
jgi:hypothetical protein